MIEIREVLGRAEQGITLPFICRGSDDKVYYVKGKGAGYASLVREWIAGRAAQLLSLPIAPFKILEMPRRLFDADRGRLWDLGYGPVFGSLRQESTYEFSMTHSKLVAPELRRDIAVFDWWVLNGDRSLSENGGNPNLLWSEANKSLVIIDHNLAFDPTVSLDSLIAGHVYGSSLVEISGDTKLQDAYKRRLLVCLEKLEGIQDELPERWACVDDLQTFATELRFEDAMNALQRISQSDFWKPRNA